MLTLGWSDGNSFIPLAFSLLSSEKKKNRYNEMDESIDKRTIGYRRRQESIKKSPQVLLELLEQALVVGVRASYVLFDSWFSFPSTILKGMEQGMHVICMLKHMPTVTYGYKEKKLTLNALYKTVRKKRGRAISWPPSS